MRERHRVIHMRRFGRPDGLKANRRTLPTACWWAAGTLCHMRWHTATADQTEISGLAYTRKLAR